MEENNQPVNEITQESQPAKFIGLGSKLILPVSILIAAVLVSGTLLYTRRATAPTGGDQSEQSNVKINVTADDHVLGDAKAKVTMFEFADFRCPFCERYFTQTFENIKKDYIDTGKVRFVFKHYAFLGQESVWIAEAAECASEQGKFWEFHDWIYQNQAPESDLAYYSKANIVKYAGKVSGVDTNRFASCFNSGKYSQRVADDFNLGDSSGVSGTPTFFINGNKLVGAQPYPVFKEAIDSALKKGKFW